MYPTMHCHAEPLCNMQVAQVPLEFLAGGGISRDERNIQFFNQFVLVPCSAVNNAKPIEVVLIVRGVASRVGFARVVMSLWLIHVSLSSVR